jgi:hypothetical protein
MDGNLPKRYRPVYRPAKPKTAKERFTRGGGSTRVENEPYPTPLVFAAADLAPPPPAPLPPDNLLLAAVKTRDLTFTLPLFDNVEQLDTIEFILNGIGQGVAKEIPLKPFYDANSDITITLSAADHSVLQEGRVDINYMVHFRSTGRDTQPGPPGQFYTTDYTKPGAPFLGQLVFSDEVYEKGVTEAALEGSGDAAYLPARVPGYTGLAPGDVITGIVGGNSETIDAVAVGGGDIELRFMRTFIAMLDDGLIPFSYSAKDRATNESDPAEAVFLQVLLKGAITDLATPLVPAYDDDDDGKELIDEADSRKEGGLDVVIPANGNIKAGDQAMLLWDGIEVGPVTIPDPTAEPLITIGVSYAAISDAWVTAGGGADEAKPATVSYRVLRNGLNAGEPATPATVSVNLHQAGGEDPDPETPENENFVVALLKSASATAPEDDNIIPPSDFDKDAAITVPWFLADGTTPGFIAGDVLRVVYGTTPLPEVTISAEMVTAAIAIPLTLTAAIIGGEGSGPNISLQYSVVRKLAIGGPNESKSPVQPIKVSGTDELPGGGVLPALEVPEAVGTIPGEPNRLAILRFEARDGTDFVIPAYKNQDPADTITLYMPVFRGAYATSDHDNHRPANGAGARDLTIIDIHPLDEASPTEVHVTEVQLMHYEFPTQLLHGHITYKIEGKADPARPVTSAELLLDIDSRGTGP